MGGEDIEVTGCKLQGCTLQPVSCILQIVK